MPMGLLRKARSPWQKYLPLVIQWGCCSAQLWPDSADSNSAMARKDLTNWVEGDRLFQGACEVSNYQVVFAPYDTEVVGIYDTKDASFRAVDIKDITTSSQKFHGCATDKYGRAVMAPHTLDWIGIFTPWMDTLEKITAKSIEGSVGPHFCGVLLLPNDKLFFVPFKHASAIILDVDDPSNLDEVSIHPEKNTAKFCNGAVDFVENTAYLAPQNLDEIGVFTVSTNGYHGESINFGEYTNFNHKFIGAAISSSRKVVFAPDRHNIIMVFDIATKRIDKIDFETQDGRLNDKHNFYGSHDKFADAITNHYGRVVLIPYQSISVWIVDADTLSFVKVQVQNPKVRGFFGGGCLGPNGKIVSPPYWTGNGHYMGSFTSPRVGNLHTTHSCVVWNSFNSEPGLQTGHVSVEQCAVTASNADVDYFAVGAPDGSNNSRCLLISSESDFTSKTVKDDSECYAHPYYGGASDRAAVYALATTSTTTTTTSTTTTSTTTTSTTLTNTTTTTILEAIIKESGGGGPSAIAVIMVGVVGGIFFVIVVGLGAYQIFRHHKPKWTKRQLKMPWELPKELYDPDNEDSLMHDKFGIDTLLNPPAEITHEEADNLHHAIKSLHDALGDMRDFEPEVFLSFTNGARDADADNTGPGMFHAAAVLKLLFGHGVPVFSTLLLPRPQKRSKSVFVQRMSHAAHMAAQTMHIGHDNPHENFLHRLQKPKKSNLKVLILVESSKFFQEQETLEQIHAATKVNDLTIIRLRFEEELPNSEQRWLQIRQGSNKKLGKMREAVEESLQTFAPVPKAPGTIPGESKHLMRALQMLAGKTNRLVNWHPEHSPWQTSNHNADWVQDWFKEIDFEPPPMEDIEDDEEDEEIHGFFGKLAHGIRKSRASVAIGSLRKSFHASRKSRASGFGDEEDQKPRPSTVSTVSAKSILKKPESMASAVKRSVKSVLFKDNSELVEVEGQPKKKKEPEPATRKSGLFKGWGGMFATTEEETPLKTAASEAKETPSIKLQKSKTGSSSNCAKAKSKKKPKAKTKADTMLFSFSQSEPDLRLSAEGSNEALDADQAEQSPEADNEEDNTGKATASEPGLDDVGNQSSVKGSAKSKKGGKAKAKAKAGASPQVVGSSATEDSEANVNLSVAASVTHVAGKKKAKMNKKPSSQAPAQAASAPPPSASKALDFGNLFAPNKSLNSSGSGNESPRAPMEIPKIVVTEAPEEQEQEDGEGW